jgi:hypothetical protein
MMNTTKYFACVSYGIDVGVQNRKCRTVWRFTLIKKPLMRMKAEVNVTVKKWPEIVISASTEIVRVMWTCQKN